MTVFGYSMSNTNEDSGEQTKSDAVDPAAGSLESAESYVTGSASSGSQGHRGGKEFSFAFSLLLDWGEKNELIKDESEFPFFSRAPDAFGDEHEVWFDEISNRWFKATYPNKFGLAWGRNESATAGEYLSRLVLQNRYFSDDVRLIALVNCSSQLRILTSQPHIAGDAAQYDEIQKWFTDLGFRRLECDSRIAWYLREENLLVADAHEGNVIRTAASILVPIDLNLIQPQGELRTWVEALLDRSYPRSA